MFKRFLSVPLAGLLIVLLAIIPASAQKANEPTLADKIMKRVTRIGTGKKAKVEVKLKDNSKLKGYIGEIAPDGFSVVNSKRGTVTPVPYHQVQQVKSTNREWLYGLLFLGGTIGGLMLLVTLGLRGS